MSSKTEKRISITRKNMRAPSRKRPFLRDRLSGALEMPSLAQAIQMAAQSACASG